MGGGGLRRRVKQEARGAAGELSRRRESQLPGDNGRAQARVRGRRS